MLKNYFKIAFRNLFKRKVYTLINILGLATGMAVVLLIVLFIQSELSYDNFHTKGDQVYRVVLERKYPGRSTSYSIIPQTIGEAIKKEFPEVLESTRIFNFTGAGDFFAKVGDKVFQEKHVLMVDSNFFHVFTAEFIEGDPVTALEKPNTIVVNESTAKRYFGSASGAMGKTIETDGDNNNKFMISAVCKNWPDNTHFLFDMLISSSTFQNTRQPNYINFSASTYLLLNKNATSEALEAKFPQIIKKYVAGDIEKRMAQTFTQFTAAGNGYHYYLQPLKKIHLNSDLEAELRPNGSIKAVYIFGIVAVFILFLASINFINLSTARSLERAKEVGIRKTFGSERRSLINQFLLESVLLSFISMIVGIIMIILLLPLFNQVADKNLSVLYFLQPLRILIIIGFALLVGLVAGIYPALVLSSFKPIVVLKGKFKSSGYGLALRNGLVVFQFAISVILIICTIIVNKQMNFMLGDRLGFKKDHIIVVERSDLLQDQTKAFKTEVAKIAGVETVSSASSLPGTQNFFGTTFQPMGAKDPLTGRGIIVDDQFEKTMSIEMKEGRFFSKDFSTDSLAIVLNEKAVKDMGLKDPIGTRLTTPDQIFNSRDGVTKYEYTVIGVVKDFHFQSLHQDIAPLFITSSARFNDQMNVTAVRIKADNFKSAAASIESKWKKFVTQRPFYYSFLDRNLTEQYKAEQTTQKIFTIFSVLAIFIGCIGLLGLAAYSTQQRMREISIRKVLGATMGNIITMLSKDFLKLVIIAAIIAFPIAWYAMNTWLQDFAYRTNISWWVFLIAGLLSAIIALGTISFQAIKAAISNPVKSLRTE
ncbi:MAG: ABC transporter permease [Chitinophagaceae bacterium]|nr:ABC transporter permease [Chitinophagaceae bacterium]